MKRDLSILLVTWAWVFCGASAVSQDDTDRAISAAIQRAAKARQEGRSDDLKREVASAAGFAGDSLPRRRLLAADLLDRGFPELAAQVCAQTIAVHPDDSKLRGIHGIALLRTRKIVEAISELKAATEKDPTRKDWWLELGRAHLQANQEAAALACIDRALAIAPGDVAVLELRAECEYRNMRIDECETTCRTLLAKDPRNTMGWQLLIRARRTQGRLDEALAAAQDAIKAIGRHPDIVLENGLALMASNRNEDAVRDLREAADRLPNDPRPYLHLCKAYTKLGLAKEALAAKARYLELSPDIPKPETRKSR